MSPRHFVLLAPILLSACPKAPPSQAARAAESADDPLWTEVEKLAAEAESLLAHQEELIWKQWTQGTPSDVARTYEGKEQLFSASSLTKIDRLRQSLIAAYGCTFAARGEPVLCPSSTWDSLEVRALGHLHAYFLGEYLAKAIAEQSDAVSNLEASLSFTAGGREYSHRDLDRLLASEKDAEKRQALYAGATRAVARLSALVRVRDERTQAVLRELGSSYPAAGEEIRGGSLDRLAFLAQQVLDLTQTAYTAAMGQLAEREWSVPLANLRRCDVPRLFRPQALAASFPKDALLARAEATFSSMGLDLQAAKNITIDLRGEARKNPRPLTVAVAIPGDVRVSLKLTGGALDQAALLHQLAFAARFASIKDPRQLHPDVHRSHEAVLRFAFQRLGSPALASASALLFEGLTDDPEWLQQHAGLSGEKVESQLATSRAHRLYEIRERSARLLYDNLVHRGEEQDLRAVYHRLMSRATGLMLTADDDARYVVDRDELYQSADELQAFVLAAQLRAALKKRFGRTWWQSRSSGELLREIWSRGSTLYPQEVPNLWGEELSAGYLRED